MQSNYNTNVNQYSFAQQNWQTIDPKYHDQFISHKVTRTSGGSQVVESQQPMKSGFRGKLENLAHRGQEMLGMTGNAHSRWALFGVNEPLLAEYPANTAYGEGSKLGGWIYVSENHFGWISHTDSMNRVVKTLIPLSNVSNIIPASRVRGVSKGTYRFVPITPGVKPDGFQLFTKDGLIYQFFGMLNVDLVLNLLMSQWKSKSAVLPPAYQTGFQQPQQGLPTGTTAAPLPTTAASAPLATGVPLSNQNQNLGTQYAPSQQEIGKMPNQPFNVAQPLSPGNKDVHTYADGHVQTFTPHLGGTETLNAPPAYQPTTAPPFLGQTAPGQRQGYY